MKLTIGMAHHSDFDGVYFSIQAARLGQDCRDVDFVVCDNSPASPASQRLREFLATVPRARYLPVTDAIGTSAPRDQIFRIAQTEAVLCMDCHVLLAPDSIRRLLNWYESNPESKDLLTGPMIYDSLLQTSTHFDLQWRSEMYGTWGTAWRCRCGWRFSIQDREGLAVPHGLMQFTPEPERCPSCGEAFPAVAYAGHEKYFAASQFKMLGYDRSEQSYEIPAQGLGLFTCRKDAWLGFNPAFRGFGGEEGYIHEKYRQAGRKCLNLPFLGWVHRFGRANGVPYTLDRYQKVRNYVIGWQELGKPIDDIHEHFVGDGLLSEADWTHLTADPIGNIAPPKPAGCGTCGGGNRAQPTDGMDLDQIYDWMKAQPRDMDKHFDRFRALAAESLSVTAFVKRREWDVCLLAGQPNTLTVYTTEPDPIHERLKALAGKTAYTNTTADSPAVEMIEETDLLCIQTVHRADRLYAELTKFAPSVRRRILVLVTGMFSEQGEPDGPGLLPAMRRYMREHSEWSVVEHSTEQFGYTLLSRLPEDKPPLPSLPRMAWNYAKAIAKHQVTGAKRASEEKIEARLNVCWTCTQRTENRCSVCGCFLDAGPNERDGKAVWDEAECPLGYWVEADAAFAESKPEPEASA